MLDVKDLEIDGFKFQLNPIKGFKGMLLDKKIVSLIAPMFKSVESLDSNINIGDIIDGLTTSLGNMSEQEYTKFVGDLISTTIFIPEGATPVEMNISVIDEYFGGKFSTVYQLLFEIMRYNNFSPFELVSRVGKETLKTFFSGKLTEPTEN